MIKFGNDVGNKNMSGTVGTARDTIPHNLTHDPPIPPEPHVATCNETHSGNWERP